MRVGGDVDPCLSLSLAVPAAGRYFRKEKKERGLSTTAIASTS